MRKISIITIIALLLCTSVQAQSYKVIINSSNSTTSLSAKEASDFFLKKKTKWSSGQKVIPVDLSSNSSVRAEFSKAILKKSVRAVQSYWQQYVFAGKGTPAVEKKTDAEVIAYVKRNSGAIGYVSSRAGLSGVKEIKVN